MKQLTSIRLDERETKKAKKLAEMLNYEQSTVMRQALEIGLAKFSQETAIQLYVDGKVSLSEAAAIAEQPIGEFMEALARRGARQEITPSIIEESLENAKKLLKK